MHQLKLCHAFESLKEAGYYLCTGKDPWEHHFGEDNYRLVKEFSSERFAAYVTGSTFVKLALRFPLPGWNEIPGRLGLRDGGVGRILTAQGGEKALSPGNPNNWLWSLMSFLSAKSLMTRIV